MTPPSSSNSESKNNNNNNNIQVNIQESWNQARQDFRTAVRTATDNLVQTQGFSRVHATKAIVHYMAHESGVGSSSGNASTSTITTTAPSDMELFSFMQKYGLGSQQAMWAMVVSSVLKHKYGNDDTTETKGRSSNLPKLLIGLRQLTEAVKRLPSDFSDIMFKTNDAEQVVVTDGIPSSTTATLPLESTNISLPVITLATNTEKSVKERTSQAFTTSGTNTNNNKRPSHPQSHRKRAAVSVQTAPVQEQTSKRLRTDSLSEVNAKVEEAEATATTTTKCSVSTTADSKVVGGASGGGGITNKTTPMVRSKRNRSHNTTVEETDHIPSTTAGKRRKTSA